MNPEVALEAIQPKGYRLIQQPVLDHQAVLERAFRGFLDTFGLDPDDPSTRETPKRVAKMYINELFWGLNPLNFPKMTVQPNFGYDEMLIETNITVNSLCEHHLVPIIGSAHVAYIPGEHVLGLSKFNRVVDYFSRRPQVQERLTVDIQKCLQEVLKTEDVAIVIDAAHMCVRMRGIRDRSSVTRTSALGGKFRQNEATRLELFNSLPKVSEMSL